MKFMIFKWYQIRKTRKFWALLGKALIWSLMGIRKYHSRLLLKTDNLRQNELMQKLEYAKCVLRNFK